MAEFVQLKDPNSGRVITLNKDYVGTSKYKNFTVDYKTGKDYTPTSTPSKTTTTSNTPTKTSTTSSSSKKSTTTSSPSSKSTSNYVSTSALDKGGAATGDESIANDTKLAADADFRASELVRAKQVLADRQAAGLDTSLQESYLAKIDAFNTGNTETNAYMSEIANRAKSYNSNVQEELPIKEEVPVAESATGDSMQKILDLIIENQRKQSEALTSAEEARYKSQEAALEKAYAQAEADAELEKQTAESNLVSQKALVDENRYAETEASRVSAEQRGIGNSAQFEALNRGTLSRAGKQKLEAAQMRDETLSSIATRINSLGLQKNLDLVSAQADRDYNINTGIASLGQSAFDQQISQYTAEQSRDFEREMLGAQQDFTASQAEIQREFTADENQLNRDQQTALQDDAQEFSASESALSRDFQAALTQAGFDHDITMFDKNANLTKFLKASDQSFQTRMYDKQRSDAKRDEAYEYAINMQREVNKYIEGTPEYDALQGAIELERNTLNANKALDFRWAERYANLETEREVASYERSLENSLNQYTEGTMEYAIAKKSNEASLKAFEDEQTVKIKAGFQAEAIAEAAQAAYAPSELPILQEGMLAFNESVTKLLAPKAFGIEDNIVDYMRDNGMIRMTDGQEAMINKLDWWKEWGADIDDASYKMLTGKDPE